MSYTPDYRNSSNLLKGKDKTFYKGFKYGIETVMCIFDNLDIYDVTDLEMMVLNPFKEHLEKWNESSEKELLCSLFSDDAYEEIDIQDDNDFPKERD